MFISNLIFSQKRDRCCLEQIGEFCQTGNDTTCTTLLLQAFLRDLHQQKEPAQKATFHDNDDAEKQEHLARQTLLPALSLHTHESD